MSQGYVIEGLIRTRAEIAGKVQNAQTELNRLLADLNAVDRVLDLSGYTETATDIPNKRRNCKIEIEAIAERRAFIRRALEAAGRPMRSSELAALYREAHAILGTDMRTRSVYRYKIINTLRGMKTAGQAVQIGKGLGAVWRLQETI